MNLRHLHYLRLVIQEGGLGAAARAAGVSQPAVSQAMQSLERELGVPLFEGRGWHKTPTPAARSVAYRAGAVASGLAQARPAEQGASGVPRLRIGMSPVAAQLYGARAVEAAHGDAGPVQLVSGAAAELLAMLQCGELDLVVGPRPRAFALRKLEAGVLCSSTPVIHARAGHPLEGAASLGELEGVGWIVVAHRGPGDMIDEAFRVRQLARPKVLVQCGDYATCLRLVAESDMMCVVPHAILLEGVQAGRVRRLHIREGLPQYDICVFRHPPGSAGDNALAGRVAAALLGDETGAG